MKDQYIIIETSENTTRYLWDEGGNTFFHNEYATRYSSKRTAQQRATYARKYCTIDSNCKIYVEKINNQG